MHKCATRLRTILVAAVVLAALSQLAVPRIALARAGGGGSGGGGGGGGGGFSSSHSYSSRSGVPVAPLTAGEWAIALVFTVITIIVIAVLIKVASARMAKERAARQARLAEAARRDPAWDPQALDARVKEVFFAFQQAWSELDIQTMSGLLTDEYFRRMVLELTVLKNMKRRNLMEDVVLFSSEMLSFEDADDDAKDRFETKVFASAADKIVDDKTGKVLHVDTEGFTEYWTFRREAGAWKLDGIRQSTESAAMLEKDISDFAAKNGFYYDADFGWLMMPDKGAIFGAHGFGTADINNHVIGYFRGKVVEFYTYVTRSGSNETNYLVAQAILPIEHHDILIRKRQWMMAVPKGLREISMEFGDFNKKFQVCADPADDVSTFELLSTNFMSRYYDLPFDLHIEVVSNVLYLYTTTRKVSYDQMLGILSQAFDEMKM